MSLIEARRISRDASDAAKARALTGTATYSRVTDSRYTVYLKLGGYGYVARERGGHRAAMNLGVELPAAVLAAAWEGAK